MKLVRESITPDWYQGIEFGKARNDFGPEPRPINNTKRKKIDSLEKKAEKIYAKMVDTPYFQVSVRKHVMHRTEKVDNREALKLIDDAISNVRRIGDTGGIIIYI